MSFIFLETAAIGSNLGDLGSKVAQWGKWGVIGLISFFLFLIIISVVAYVNWQKKKWYLTVILKMPRDGARTLNCEVAKGYWNARNATLWVKRKGFFGSKFFVKMDDVRKYLQGNETVELIGSGIDWKPIMFESYLEMTDEDTGQNASIMKYSMDFTRDKAWALRAEREYVNTFSLSDWMSKFKDYIGWGLVIGIVILAEVIRVAYVGS